jgi:hypothetical protein
MVELSRHRCLAVLALGLSLLSGSGCAVARGMAEGLADEGPARGSPGSAGLRPSADLGGTRDAAPAPSPTTAYLVSPAVTWGELQLHRPHALTGSLFDRTADGRLECRPSLQPFVVTGVPTTSQAQDVVRTEHTGFGVNGQLVLIGTDFRLDPEAMADRAMRSGAFLVQRGPICAESLWLTWTFNVGGDGGAVAFW